MFQTSILLTIESFLNETPVRAEDRGDAHVSQPIIGGLRVGRAVAWRGMSEARRYLMQANPPVS